MSAESDIYYVPLLLENLKLRLNYGEKDNHRYN